MIVVPFTALHAENITSVPDAMFIHVENPNGYRELLRRFWEIGHEFVLVEHDVAPTRDQLTQLYNCDHPWCGFSYLPGDWTPVFGCVRFSADLIKATAGVWDHDWPWMQLDGLFADYARAKGFKHHWHYPHVRHVRIPHVDEGGEQRIPLPLTERIALLDREAHLLAAADRNTI